jgi:hypothetical protein
MASNLRVQLAMGYSSQARLASNDAAWVDVTDRVVGLRTNLGRSSIFDSYGAGDFEFLMNSNDREFDPKYASGTHYGTFLYNTHFQLVYESGATHYVLYYGLVEEFDLSIIKRDISVRVSGSDILRVLGETNIPALTEHSFYTDKSILYAGEPALDRFFEILEDNTNGAALDSGWIGETYMGQTPLFGYDMKEEMTTGVNVLNHLSTMAFADGGWVFAGVDGKINFFGPASLKHSTRQHTSQATIVADGTQSGLFIRDDSLVLGSQQHTFRNYIAMKRNDGDQTFIVDRTTESGIPTKRELSDSNIWCAHNGDARALAEYYAIMYSNVDPYVKSVSIPVSGNLGAQHLFFWPWVNAVSRDIRDRMTVTYDYPGTVGGTETSVVIIEGIENHVAGGEWVQTFHFTPAGPLDDLGGTDWASFETGTGYTETTGDDWGR